MIRGKERIKIFFVLLSVLSAENFGICLSLLQSKHIIITTMDFKQDFFYRLWKEKDKTSFEQWIYNSNSLDFETVVGDKSYLEIISEIHSGLTLREMKSLVFQNLPT